MVRKIILMLAVTAPLAIPAAANAFDGYGHGGYGHGGYGHGGYGHGGYGHGGYGHGGYGHGGYGHGGYTHRRRWWPSGVGPCWQWTPYGWTWVC